MALARSASGPGALSINTNSANSLFGSGTTSATGGMFGNTGASKPGGLFGSSTATTTAPQTGGLFGSTAATSQQQAGGLFGSAPAQPQAGGLFGSNTPASQPQTGGLFGSTAAATTQPQTGGLFGAAQPQQSGGLFGNTATTQPAQTTGLFGASATASQPQHAGGLFGAAPAQPAQGGLGGGLFGGLNNNQNQAKPATSLFGSGLGSTSQSQQQPQNQQQSSSMFPTLNQNQGGGLFGSTLGGGPSLGQSTNQQQQTVPGVRIDVSQLRGTTRFNDLHDDIQKQVKLFDDVIQGQMRLKDDCEAIMPAHANQLAQIPNDVEFCRRKRIGVENAQDSDAQAIAIVQRLIKVDAEHAKLSFKAVNNLKLPSQYHNAGPWTNSSANDNRGQENGDSNAQDIVSFFNQTADELAATLNTYQKHIVEIEQHLRSVEANSAQQINALVTKRNGTATGQEDARSELIAVLNDFEQGMIAVASKVGGSREGLQSLQLDGFGASQNGQRNGRRNGLY